jgi:hypothetical protein
MRVVSISVGVLFDVLWKYLTVPEAGDTAQCISKDSVFRFSEIKALLYDYYATVARESGQPELARPAQFSLSRNYRSHQGILSLASFVMQLLWTGELQNDQLDRPSYRLSVGFPDTIDKLDPEIGQLGGPRPIIFGMPSSLTHHYLQTNTWR